MHEAFARRHEALRRCTKPLRDSARACAVENGLALSKMAVRRCKRPRAYRSASSCMRARGDGRGRESAPPAGKMPATGTFQGDARFGTGGDHPRDGRQRQDVWRTDNPVRQTVNRPECRPRGRSVGGTDRIVRPPREPSRGDARLGTGGDHPRDGRQRQDVWRTDNSVRQRVDSGSVAPRPACGRLDSSRSQPASRERYLPGLSRLARVGYRVPTPPLNSTCRRACWTGRAALRSG